MSDLPSTPTTKTQPSVAPTPGTSGDSSPRQGADHEATGDGAQADPTRDAASVPAVTLSASVAGLREGSTIHGEVGNTDARGRPTLKSAAASFAILSESTLKAGQSVLLDVFATEPVLKATLITVDGGKLPRAEQLQLAVTDVPPERLAARARIDVAIAMQSETDDTAPAVSHLNPAIAPTGLQTNGVVTGSAVITTAEAPDPVQLQPLPLGSPVVVTVLGPATRTTTPVDLTQSGDARATPAKPPIASADRQRRISYATVTNTVAFATESVAAHATAYPETQAGPAVRQAPTGSASVTRTDSPEPGSLPPLTGLVVGHSISGQAVIQTPVGLLTVDNLEAVPKDIAIEIEVRPQQTSRPAAVPAAALTPQSTLLTFGQEWQTLKEIISVLAATDPAAAQRFVDSSTPAMNHRLASSMIFFFVAVQGGVPRTWLGDAVSKALERAGRADLIERLSNDFSSMRRLSEERGPGDWRPFLFPFFDGEELQQLRMFTRQGDEKREDDDEGDRPRSVRFVVDTSLTKLGELQFDGLVQERRFDLIVRSKSRLADNLRQEISAIFTDGLETTSFRGNIVFEETPEFPVSPSDEVLRGTNGNEVMA